MNDRKSRFHKLFTEEYPDLLIYACSLVGENEASDVVQDVFINFWSKGYSTEDSTQAKKILYRSVYNRSMNIIRHRRIRNVYSETVARFHEERIKSYYSDTPEVIIKLHNKFMGKNIEDALASLPEQPKRAFTLCYMYDLSEKETAEIMGLSVRTVEAHIYRALRILREKLSSFIVLAIVLLLLCK